MDLVDVKIFFNVKITIPSPKTILAVYPPLLIPKFISLSINNNTMGAKFISEIWGINLDKNNECSEKQNAETTKYKLINLPICL